MFLALLFILQVHWEETELPGGGSLRAVTVGDDGFVCAVGTVMDGADATRPRGIVYCSGDGGKTWLDRTPDRSDVADYRCVSLVNSETLIIASAGSPAVILRSDDRGESWVTVFEDGRPDAFIDSVCFRDEDFGIAFGDPIDGQFLLLATNDAGVTWNGIPCEVEPRDGEAGFAASNGLISFPDEDTIVIGLGASGQNAASRVLRSTDRGKSWKWHLVEPIPVGPSSGIFGISIQENGAGVAVGGDYRNEDKVDGNIAVTKDGGVTWRKPKGAGPSGFRSSVLFVAGESASSRRTGYWLAVGPNGTDMSRDGESWTRIGQIGFHALAGRLIPGADEKSPLAVGSGGRLGILNGQAE